MTLSLAVAFRVLLAVAFLGLAAEAVVLVLGLRRWWRLLRGPYRSADFSGGDDVPVCFVLVDAEPTVEGIRRIMDHLAQELGSGARSFEARILLPGAAHHSRDLIEDLGAVRLPRGDDEEAPVACALSFGWGGQILFQADNSFGELLCSVAETARSPYFAVLPADALPSKRQLDAMTGVLAERSDDPVVLGSPAALAFRGAADSWKSLRRGACHRSALLAWGGPGTLGMSAFWSAPVLVSRERVLETAREPSFDRGEWLERLGAATRGRSIAVTPDDSPGTGAAGPESFWVSGRRLWLVRAAWMLLSALAPVRALLLGVALLLAVGGDLHGAWSLWAVFAALVLPTSLRFLGQLGLEVAWPPASPARLLRLAVGSTCLAPFASGFARRGWI